MPSLPIPNAFVDRTPRRGPWLAPTDEPEPYSWDNQILLADGTTNSGVFMPGAGWWVRDAYRPIVGWRKYENRQITCGLDLRVRTPLGGSSTSPAPGGPA